MSSITTGAVFLSYASQDGAAARRIADALGAAGVEVWFDQSGLKGGAAWDAEIRRRIHECVLFVPVVSTNTEQRREGYFRLEWRLAEQRTYMMAKGKPFLVPVVIDDTREDRAQVPDAFADVQWTRLSGDDGAESFARHVKCLLTQAELPPTVHGNARPDYAPAARSQRRRSAVMALLFGVGLLFLAVATVTWVLRDKWLGRAASPLSSGAVATATGSDTPAVKAPRTAVAVLPFANLTGDASKDYLGDGMAEELINTLTKLPELKVPARTSTFAYKGRAADIRQIAKDLGVGTILEGSVRAAGKRLRITAQLINAEDGLHLWSQNYDDDIADIFKLQDKLARQIAAALQVSLGTGTGAAIPRTNGTSDVEAYNLALQGSSLVDKATADHARAAIELFKQAIRRDPAFPRAWSGLSRAHFNLGAGLRSDSELMESERAARQALMLDPGDSLAHTVLGRTIALRDFLEAQDHWRAALDSAPEDYYPHSLYVGQLLQVGHIREAIAEGRRGYALAPASANAMSWLATSLSAGGAQAEAAKLVTMARAMFGSDVAGAKPLLLTEVRVALTDRRLEAAVEAAARFSAPGEIDRTSLGLLMAAVVDPAQRSAARAIKDRFLRSASPSMKPASVTYRWLADSANTCMAGYLYASMGALDEAYELVDPCLPASLGQIGSLWAPELAAFRRDPRFAGYVGRLGSHLIEYWLKYGPPDGCELKAGELACH